MKLYGSTTSPYARRLRLFMAEMEYEFINIDVFGDDRTLLKEKNPTLKIPMLEDLDNATCPIIYDSGVIHQYLVNKFKLSNLSITQQTQLAVIDACTDALLNMLFLARSGVDTTQDNLYFNAQRERTVTSLNQLEKLVSDKHIHEWDYVAISLYCLVEWAEFRQLVDLSEYRNINAFMAVNDYHKGIKQTKPSA